MIKDALKKITVLGRKIIGIGIFLACIVLFADIPLGQKIISSLILVIIAFFVAWLVSISQHGIRNMSKRNNIGSFQEFVQKSNPDNDKLIEDIVRAYNNSEYNDIDDKLGKMPQDQQREIIYCALDKIIAAYQESGEVSDNDENHFCSFTEHFNIQQTELYGQSFYQEFVKLLVINDLLQGKLPTRVTIPPESVLINLQKNEHVLWAFTDVQLLELTKKVTRVGSASGWSGRVLKGLYYKKSSFRGESIVTQKMEYIAIGLAYITDKNIYFNAPERGVRIPYAKIVSYIPYEDGLGILRDGTTSKPLCLKNIDGWFAYNFVKNIGNITNE